MPYNKSFLGDKETRRGYTTTSNLVMLNFQPLYQDMFVFDPDHLSDYVQDYTNILYLYEEENSAFDVYQIQAFLEDTCGIDDIDFLKVETKSKEEGFFLDFKDLDVNELELVKFIRYMDSNEKELDTLTFDEYKKLGLSKELSFGKLQEQNFYIPDIYRHFEYDKFTFIGGPEEDSLWEFKIMFDALKLKYELDYDFIF